MRRQKFKRAIEWPLFDPPPFPPERIPGETEAFVRSILKANASGISLSLIALGVMKASAIHETETATGEIRRRVARVLGDLERQGEAHRVTGANGKWLWAWGKAGAFDV